MWATSSVGDSLSLPIHTERNRLLLLELFTVQMPGCWQSIDSETLFHRLSAIFVMFREKSFMPFFIPSGAW